MHPLKMHVVLHFPVGLWRLLIINSVMPLNRKYTTNISNQFNNTKMEVDIICRENSW